MLPGPILRREVRAAVGDRHFTMRTPLAAMLGSPAVAYGVLEFGAGGRPPGLGEGPRLQAHGAFTLATALVIAFGFFPLANVVVAAAFASLCTTRQLERLAAGLASFPWIAAVLVAGAAAMAAAHRVTRPCFERVDERVGRPHRTRGTATSLEPAVEVRAGPRTPSVARVP